MKHIQWFPGHMTKAMRMMEDSVKLCDGVLVILDARAPAATYNKNLKKLFGNRPVLYVLNKSDLADEGRAKGFCALIERGGAYALPLCATDSSAAKRVGAKISSMLSEKHRKDEEKGMRRPDRLMVAGIPNTGKSTVINALSGAKRAITGDKAGVTRGKQWIRCAGFELLDTPGTMPPSFENQYLARHLAYIGCINDDILDFGDLSIELLGELSRLCPDKLAERYGISDFSAPLAMLEQLCKRRGFILRGGEFDYERGAKALVDDFRKGRIGSITLESPEEFENFGV
jgi:ribosome biogenesis GTP-binding protein ylqF